MASSGGVLLAAGLAGESAEGVIAVGGVAWVLGVTVLFLTGGLQRDAPWWSVPALVGALALLGMPPILGFGAQATLLGGLASEARLGLWFAFLVGNLFLVASLVRWLLLPPLFSPARRWSLVVRGVGLGVPALLLIVAGIYSPMLIPQPSPSLGRAFALPGLVGWLLWVVSLVGGIIFSNFQR